MAAFSRLAKLYAIDSLHVYRSLRKAAKEVVAKINEKDINMISIHGDDEVMDIMQLTCLENGIEVDNDQDGWFVEYKNNHYELAESRKKK
jgi:hypothetical protein